MNIYALSKTIMDDATICVYIHIYPYIDIYVCRGVKLNYNKLKECYYNMLNGPGMHVNYDMASRHV